MKPVTGRAARTGRGPSPYITAFVCGDVMTGRGIDQVLEHPSDPILYEPYLKSAVGYVELAERKYGPVPRRVQPAYIWGDVLEELERRAPDLRIINLETSVTVCDEYWPHKGINYRMHPANIDCLTACAIDCCSLANNHVLDWGHAGLLETLETLQSRQISCCGAGRDRQEAGQPAAFTVAGKGRVILLACGLPSSGIPHNWAAGRRQPGVNLLEDMSPEVVRRLGTMVREVKQPGDIVILSLHWGDNWGYQIPAEHVAFAHRLIDEAGIDLLYGHSSHHVLGIEVYRHKPVIYGCGDFLNDYEGIHGYDQYRGDLGLMYFPTMDPADGNMVELRMVPTHIRRLQVSLATADEGAWLRKVLSRESSRFGTNIELDHDNSLIISG